MVSRDPQDKYKRGDQQDWLSRRDADQASYASEVQELLNQIDNLNAQAEKMSKSLKEAIDAFDAQGDHTEEEIQAFSKWVNKRIGLIKGRATSVKKLQKQIAEEHTQHNEYTLALEQEGAVIREEVRQNARKRRTVSKGLRSKFSSSRIAAAFMKNYIQPDGTMTIAGEKKAEQIRNQNQFIRKLVQSFATLPIFQKAGRAFQQLGVMTMMSGVSKFRQGGFANQLQGAGLVGLGLAEYLAPAMASAFGTVMTNIVAKKIMEAVAIGTMKGNLGGGFGKFGSVLGKLIGPLAVFGAIGIGASDLQKKKQGYDLSTPKGRALSQATGVAQGSMILTGVLGAIGALIAAAISAPIAPIILATGVIAAVMYGIGKNIDTILDWFSKVKDAVVKIKEKFFGKATQARPDYFSERVNPSYTAVDIGTNKIVQSVANKEVGKARTFDTGDFIIHQYGNSQMESGGYTVLGSQYTKEQLEAMGAAGKGGLETLKGLQLANTFTNDARVARAGSSAILQAVQAKIGAPLLITSAMSSKTSKHALGLLGHAGGQKFDFDASGLNEEQAKAKAAQLYATGYFSHAEAEYDKKTGQWHIDARISNQAYKAVADIQKEEQSRKLEAMRKTSPRLKEAPGTQMYNDVIQNSMGLSNSVYGPANGVQR